MSKLSRRIMAMFGKSKPIFTKADFVDQGLCMYKFPENIPSIKSKSGQIITFDPPVLPGETIRYTYKGDDITGCVCEGHEVTIEKVKE